MNDGQKIPVSAFVFTLDEEVNLPACLESLSRFDEVVVVDSYSSDRTVEIARARGARVFQHEFTGFGDQRNWAFDHCSPRNRWALVLDADERVPEELAREIGARAASAPEEVSAFRLRRRFHLWGKWLKHSSLYPTWLVRLVRTDRVRYVNRGHGETQEVDGAVLALEHDLIDENRKGEGAFRDRQAKYACDEARYELAAEDARAGAHGFFSSDPLARRAAMKRLSWNLPMRPLVYFLYSYVWRGGFLDGAEGFRFCAIKSRYVRTIVREKRRLRKEAV